VHLVTVTNEKEIADLPSHTELANHLLKHGIEVRLELVDAKGRSAGATLTDTLNANGSTLLVMGAYGHSRIKEFILGGATKSMLENPPLPVFLSH
jgi:nucleotide-binding universal stress UspA family protein